MPGEGFGSTQYQALLRELCALSPSMLADIGAEGTDLRAFARAAVRGKQKPASLPAATDTRPTLAQSTIAIIRIGSS